MNAIRKYVGFAGICLVVVLLTLVDRGVANNMVFTWDVVRAALIFSLLFISVGFLGGRIGRVVLGVVLFYLLLIESLNVFLWLFFKMELSGSLLSILLASSPEEVMSFGALYWRGIVSVSLTTLAVVVLIVSCLRRVGFPRRSVASLTLGFLLCVPYLALNLVPQKHAKPSDRHAASVGWFHRVFGNRPGWYAGLTALSFPISSYRHERNFHQNLIKACRNPDIPEKLSAEGMQEAPLYVFAIGESATRNHWSLYGYPRKTTPCLDALKSDLCVFEDVDGVCHGTSEALHFLLTGAMIENPGNPICALSTVCKRAGFRCVLISVQTSWQFGHKDEFCPIRLVFSGCEKQIFTAEKQTGGSGEKTYDDSVLPYLRDEILASAKVPTVIFLHFRGSHFPPNGNYPPSAAVFHGNNQLVDEYDNAIRFQDYVLGEVIAQVKATARPSFVLYVSDHGETPEADNWRCMTDKSLWELPMIVWFSPEYRQSYPEVVKHVSNYACQKMQSDELLGGFVTLCRIWGGVNLGSFADGTLKPRLRRRTQNGKELK